MRTTLTLDDAVGRELKAMAGRTNRPFRAVVNETLRAGLEAQASQQDARKPFKVRAMHCGFRTGIDTEKLNQLVDDLSLSDQLPGQGAE